MFGRIALGAALLAACSSAAPPPGGSVMTTEPIVVFEPAPTSSCPDAASCDRDCATGDAAACTRSADMVYTRDPKAARTQYEAACTKRDRSACARLVELAGDDLRGATNAARVACGTGDVGSCVMLSELSVLAFGAPRPGEDSLAMLALSEQSSSRGCELGSYRACFNLVALLRYRKAPAASVNEAAMRGLVHAEAACAERRLGGCAVVAEWAEKSKDPEAAALAYIGQCAIERRWTSDELTRIASCKKAIELGQDANTVAEATAPGKSEPSEHLVSRSAIEAKRIAGDTQVQPSAAEYERIRASKTPAQAIAKLCISARGGVESITYLRLSQYPDWNRRLYEAMRGWRYWPFMLDGAPERVCTSITFVFRAN